MLSDGLFRTFPRPDGDPGGVGCSHRAPVQQHLLEALRRVINTEAAASAAPKAPTIVVQDGMHSVENDPTLVTGLLPVIKGRSRAGHRPSRPAGDGWDRREPIAALCCRSMRATACHGPRGGVWRVTHPIAKILRSPSNVARGACAVRKFAAHRPKK